MSFHGFPLVAFDKVETGCILITISDSSIIFNKYPWLTFTQTLTISILHVVGSTDCICK